DAGLGLAREPDEAQDALGRVLAPGEPPDQPDGLGDGELGGEPALLEHRAGARAHRTAVRGSRAEHADGGGRRRPVPLDDLEGRGLAGTVGAEERVELAALDLEG